MYSGGAGSQLRLSFWSEIYFCWCCPGLYLPRECPTPGSVPPHLQCDPYNLEVSGRAFSAGNSGDFVLSGPSREAGLSPTAPGAACLPTPPCVLLSLCIYHQQNLCNQTPGLAPLLSSKPLLLCWLFMKNGKQSGLQKFAVIQLMAAPPVLSEDGAGRKGAVRKSRRGEEATGMTSPAAGQHFFSVQLLLGFTSLSLWFKWKL